MINHPSGKAREIRLAMMIDRSHTKAMKRFMATLERNPSCITCP